MKQHNEFWQRPVSDTLVLELMPGEQPSLLVNCQGDTVLTLGFAEARALIEALTVAVGELLILKKDPAALARLNALLAEDVTLNGEGDDGQPTPVIYDSNSHLKGQELIRRYSMGERSFPELDLRMADLQGADLREVDLSGSDLRGANLKRANLFQANLKGTNLSQANLEEAGLFQANLQAADLRDASLHRAYLNKANLADAHVTETQLADATLFGGTVLPDGTEHS